MKKNKKEKKERKTLFKSTNEMHVFKQYIYVDTIIKRLKRCIGELRMKKDLVVHLRGVHYAIVYFSYIW
jgi:hypothetical protein